MRAVKSMTKPYRSHDEALQESLRNDPTFAAEYLNAVIEDGDQAELMLHPIAGLVRRAGVVDEGIQ